ncbi:MAG: hypothetical protein KF858_07295 [Candidatus Sumerlaeia bacterium]|nr:hypothetical protein [Candidatus Sumerlaeia bacterium]
MMQRLGILVSIFTAIAAIASAALDLPDGEGLRKTYHLPGGNLIHTESFERSTGRTTAKLYWDADAKGVPVELVNDGYWHKILAVCEERSRIVLTYESADRERLLHTRRPTPSQRFVALIDAPSRQRYRLATLAFWDSVHAKFSPDGETVVILGQIGDSVAPRLATWSLRDQQLRMLESRLSDVSQFLPFDDGRVAIAGTAVVDGLYNRGVFIVGPDDAPPVVVEGNISVEWDSLSIDTATGKVQYRVRAPISYSGALQQSFDDRLLPESTPFAVVESDQGRELRVGDAKVTTLREGQVPRWVRKVADGTLLLEREQDSDSLVLLNDRGERVPLYAPDRFLDPRAIEERSGRLLMVSKPLDIAARRRVADKPLTDWDQRLIVLTLADGSVQDFGVVPWYRVHPATWTADGTAFFACLDQIYRGRLDEGTLEVFINAGSVLKMKAFSEDLIAFTSVLETDDGLLISGLFVAEGADSIRLLDPIATGATIVSVSPSEVVYEDFAGPGRERKTLPLHSEEYPRVTPAVRLPATGVRE